MKFLIAVVIGAAAILSGGTRSALADGYRHHHRYVDAYYPHHRYRHQFVPVFWLTYRHHHHHHNRYQTWR